MEHILSVYQSTVSKLGYSSTPGYGSLTGKFTDAYIHVSLGLLIEVETFD